MQNLTTQKKLTYLLSMAWIALIIFATHMAMTLPPVPTSFINLVLLSLLFNGTVFIGVIWPAMLGLGVMFYRNLWKKSEERSTEKQESVYRSYLTIIIKPLLPQLIIGIILVLIGKYFIPDMDIRLHITLLSLNILHSFIIGVAIRLFAEYRHRR